MKKRFTMRILILTLATTAMVVFAVSMSNKTHASCLLDTLSSPPSTMSVYSGTCTSGMPCDRSVTTTFTLSNAGTCTHTWTFTNTTTSCVKVFNTASGVGSLQVSIPGSTGDAITLVISDGGGGSGPTYNITGSQCN